MKRSHRTWITTTAATALCAVSGSLATDTKSTWYESLNKPSWQPPGVVFPFVWTALYTGLAATSARTINELDSADRTDEAAGFKSALLINLALNQGWSWTFFKANALKLATLNAAALAASSIDLACRSSKVNPAKGKELVPYAAWCTFATALTAAIAYRNRRPE